MSGYVYFAPSLIGPLLTANLVITDGSKCNSIYKITSVCIIHIDLFEQALPTPSANI